LKQSAGKVPPKLEQFPKRYDFWRKMAFFKMLAPTRRCLDETRGTARANYVWVVVGTRI
jgi:hypothetical protein